MKVVFLGDISLNDNYNFLYSEGKKPFKGVLDVLTDSDLVVGNLECLADNPKGEYSSKWPRLKTKPTTLNYLTDINLGLACLANNHVYDNLVDGFRVTTEFLADRGISYIGASTTDNEGSAFIFERDEITIAILNYVSKDTNPNIPMGISLRINWLTLEKVTRDIDILRDKVDYIIVYPHWGGRMEGAVLPDRGLITLARQIIQAGADMIIGHHSHTLQPYEMYKGKHIFYSLGNFCFSNTTLNGVLYRETYRARHSVLLSIIFSKDSIHVDSYPIRNSQCFIVKDISLFSNKLHNIKHYDLVFKKDILWRFYMVYENYVYKYISILFALRNPLQYLIRRRYIR